MTYTCALMEVSDAAWTEIEAKLRAAGYGHAIVETSKGKMLDMTHIGLVRAPPKVTKKS